ncbi:hypothetical protein AB0I28_28075 [Phytomonospora sp. NPDC050363]|uniref:hypothetical protein n=1 Tax=Phytomonospora sp. NPDC050363 TaxID=3155642 RepID=UPI0033DCBE27
MTRIVGVHGVLQYRPGDPLRAGEAIAAQWREHLGPDRPPGLEVAYFADLVRKPGAYGEPLNVDRLDADAWSLLTSYLVAALPDLDDGGRLRVSPRTGMAILAGRRNVNGAATHGFLVAFAREAARFLRAHGRAGTREAVTARVARRMAGADVVVAHSLGAVVAYETLWAHSPIAIPLLITIGSPLAVPGAVFPHLSSPTVDGRRGRPPNVDRWIDVLDPRDLFAVPGGEVAALFDGVEAHAERRVPAFDAHQPGGYLRSEPVGRALTGLDLVNRAGSGQVDRAVEG